MWFHTGLLLFLLMSSSFHIARTDSSCFSDLKKLDLVNNSHISMEFLHTSCDYGSILIYEIPKTSTYCQIVDTQREESNDRCFCTESRCKIIYPMNGTCATVWTKSFKIIITKANKEDEKLFMHVSLTDICKVAGKNCSNPATTSSSNNNIGIHNNFKNISNRNNNHDNSNSGDGDNLIVPLAVLSVLASVSLLLLITGSLVFSLKRRALLNAGAPGMFDQQGGREKVRGGGGRGEGEGGSGGGNTALRDVDDYGYSVVHDAYNSHLRGIAPGMPKSAVGKKTTNDLKEGAAAPPVACSERKTQETQEMYTPVEVIQERKKQQREKRREREKCGP